MERQQRREHGFSQFFVLDSSCNPVGVAAGEKLYHPDDAFTAAVNLVRDTWKDFEVASIYGVVEIKVNHDVGETTTHETEVKIAEVFRDGPPGSSKVRIEHAAFPWLSMEVP